MRSTTAVGLLAVLALTSACDNAELEAERDNLARQVDELTTSSKRLEKENAELASRVRVLTRQVEEARTREVMSRLGVAAGDTLSATFQTSKGEIRCDLMPQVAPQTVLNFVELARGDREWTDPVTKRKTTRPLYDGTVFHRVIPNFMIQGGDPLGNGTGGPGYRFEDETSPDVTFDRAGLLAMANSGPNTNGSQFFITDRSTPTHLNGKHTIFGRCDNADVVQAIAEAERGPRDKPAQDIVLERVVITTTKG